MEAPALKLIVLALAMAVVRGAPDLVGSRAMELREGPHNLTTTKQPFRTSPDTLNGEERGHFDFIRSISSNSDPSLRERLLPDTFVPPILKSEENYLGASEFAERAKPFLKSGEGYDTIMNSLRDLHGDVVVANIIVKGMRKSRTKDLAFRLGDTQIRQWIREDKTPETVFDLLKLDKKEGVRSVFKHPLFNTWAEFVLKKYRLQQNKKLATASANLIPETVLVLKKLKSFEKEMEGTFGLMESLIRLWKRIGSAELKLLRLREEAKDKFADVDRDAYRAMGEVLSKHDYKVEWPHILMDGYHVEEMATAMIGSAKI